VAYPTAARWAFTIALARVRTLRVSHSPFVIRQSSFVIAPRAIAPRPAFTLLELLAAIALIALVGLSMFTTLRIAIRARDSAEALVEPVRTADIVFETIRQDLENAQPPRGTLASTTIGNDRTDDRNRESDDIFFYTTASGAQHVSGDGELRQVEYLVLPPDGSNADYRLVRRVTHNLLSQFKPPPDDEVLLRGIGGFNLRYYDPTTATWVDQWDSTQYDNNLPSVVEVSIDLDRPDRSVGADPATPRTHRFVRHVQLPCAVPAQNTSGLTGR
jgi:prepilin-type N-terminal cleavage/methylation domain-containing protein